MAGVAPKKATQASGHITPKRPMPPVTPAASAAPVHAIRDARAGWPAPMFVPTMASSPAPRPKVSGYRTYSSRTAAPKPASAVAPSEPTNDARQCTQDPVSQRSGEDRVGVLDGRGKSGPAAAHQRVEGRARNQQHRCEHGRHAAGNHEPVDDQRRGVLLASRSDGAGDG